MFLSMRGFLAINIGHTPQEGQQFVSVALHVKKGCAGTTLNSFGLAAPVNIHQIFCQIPMSGSPAFP